MRRVYIAVMATALLLASWCGPVAAASGPKTVPDMVKDWLSLAGKDFKRVKSTDTFVTFTPFANRTLNTMSATGLDGNGTVWASLTPDLQNALTKLDTDLNNLKTKQSDFSKLVSDVTNALRSTARSTVPPSIEASTVLAYAAYNSAFDGVINSKESAVLTEANAAVQATPSLDPKLAASIQSAVTALQSGSGISKLDLDLIKTDLASIANVLKLLK